MSGLRVALRGNELRVSRTQVVGGPHVSGQQQRGAVQQKTPEQALLHVCGGSAPPVGLEVKGPLVSVAHMRGLTVQRVRAAVQS